MTTVLSLLFAAIAAVALLVTVWQARQAHNEQLADRSLARREREEDRHDRRAERQEVEQERQARRSQEADDRRADALRRWRRELIEIGQLVEDLSEASKRTLAPAAVSPYLHQLRRALIGHRDELPRCVAMAEDVHDGMYHGIAAGGAREEVEQKLNDLADEEAGGR